jgi:GNAT superfamily N-acetyltransferase
VAAHHFGNVCIRTGVHRRSAPQIATLSEVFACIAIAVETSVTTQTNLRPARTSDAQRLATLRFGLRSRPTNIESEQEFLERCTRWMTKVLAQDNWRCWVAERDDEIVGALWLQLVEKVPNPTAEPERLGYITNFYVAESQRGKGLGSQMLEEVLTWCREQRSGKGSLINDVVLWPSDRSRSLYLRNGFKVPENLLELELGELRAKS